MNRTSMLMLRLPAFTGANCGAGSRAAAFAGLAGVTVFFAMWCLIRVKIWDNRLDYSIRM